MPKVKEFRVTIEDKPGALGKCCLALGEHGVNILAFQSYVEQGESLARFVVDDPARAVAVLGSLRMNLEEEDVAVVRLAHRPSELGRVALRLGENQINIDYSYCGLEPDLLDKENAQAYVQRLLAGTEARAPSSARPWIRCRSLRSIRVMRV
jgi:hypothetical protein